MANVTLGGISIVQNFRQRRRQVEAAQEVKAEIDRLKTQLKNFDEAIKKYRGAIGRLSETLQNPTYANDPSKRASVENKLRQFENRLNQTIDRRNAAVAKLQELTSYTATETMEFYVEREQTRQQAAARATAAAKQISSSPEPAEKEGGSMLVPAIVIGGAALGTFLLFKG